MTVGMVVCTSEKDGEEEGGEEGGGGQMCAVERVHAGRMRGGGRERTNVCGGWGACEENERREQKEKADITYLRWRGCM